MSEKDLANLNANLAQLASPLPTQKPAPTQQAKLDPPARKPAPSSEEVIQFNMSMRKSLRKEIARMADDEDMTMRAFVLNVLKEKGLKVTEGDLLDKRKDR